MSVLIPCAAAAVAVEQRSIHCLNSNFPKKKLRRVHSDCALSLNFACLNPLDTDSSRIALYGFNHELILPVAVYILEAKSSD